MDIENLAGKWPNVAINPENGLPYESGYKDTREQIEEDIFCYRVENDSQILSVPIYRVKSWLDRQAAITKNECREEHRKRLGELHDLLDEAARKREELSWRVEYNGELVEKVKRERNELQDEIEYLRKVCQTQADSFAAIENENAALRSKLNRIRELAERLQDA